MEEIKQEEKQEEIEYDPMLEVEEEEDSKTAEKQEEEIEFDPLLEVGEDEASEAAAETEEIEYDLLDIDPDADAMAAMDKKAEEICRWGAARAGVIVVVPALGSVSLLANEVYMITRLAANRNITLSEASIISLLGSLGAAFVGQTLATLAPIPTLQIPIGISVTYGIGEAVDAWLKAGRPSDMSEFKEIFAKARDNSACHITDFQNLECANKPLGDETRTFGDKAFGVMTNVADVSAEKLEEMFGVLADKIFGEEKKDK